MKDREIDHLNRIESIETDSHIYSRLINDKHTLQYSEERIVHSINGSESIRRPNRKKINFDPTQKINSKWITNLNVRGKTITFLVENYMEHFQTLE